MQPLNFEDILSKMVEADQRYHRDAYIFLREALEHTQKAIGRSGQERVRHITPRELLEGIREYGLASFGPMTHTVFAEWGLHSCLDFGHMVFRMVENNLLRKTEQDRLEDFEGAYSFEEAFEKPFWPAARRPSRPLQPPHPPEPPRQEPASAEQR